MNTGESPLAQAPPGTGEGHVAASPAAFPCGTPGLSWPPTRTGPRRASRGHRHTRLQGPCPLLMAKPSDLSNKPSGCMLSLAQGEGAPGSSGSPSLPALDLVNVYEPLPAAPRHTLCRLCPLPSPQHHSEWTQLAPGAQATCGRRY